MLQATPNAGRTLVASEVPAVSAPELAALQGRVRQRTSAPQREDSMLWAWERSWDVRAENCSLQTERG